MGDPVLITMLRLAASRAAARWMPSMPQASFCSSTDLLSGTVKWYDSSKGYGFITQDKDGSDLFCHQTTIEIDGFRQLHEGDLVEYSVKETDRGPQTASVYIKVSQDPALNQGPHRIN